MISSDCSYCFCLSPSRTIEYQQNSSQWNTLVQFGCVCSEGNCHFRFLGNKMKWYGFQAGGETYEQNLCWFLCVRVGLGGCLVVWCGVYGVYYFPGRHSLYSRPPTQSVQHLTGEPSDPKCLINIGFLPIELPLSCNSNSEFCPHPLFNLLYKAFSPHFPDSVLSSRAVNWLLLGQTPAHPPPVHCSNGWENLSGKEAWSISPSPFLLLSTAYLVLYSTYPK